MGTWGILHSSEARNQSCLPTHQSAAQSKLGEDSSFIVMKHSHQLRKKSYRAF